MFLALLNMAEVQVNCFVAPYATGKQNGQKGSITFSLQALAIWSLPQPLRLFGSEPVSQPYADFLNTPNSSDQATDLSSSFEVNRTEVTVMTAPGSVLM